VLFSGNLSASSTYTPEDAKPTLEGPSPYARMLDCIRRIPFDDEELMELRVYFYGKVGDKVAICGRKGQEFGHHNKRVANFNFRDSDATSESESEVEDPKWMSTYPSSAGLKIDDSDDESDENGNGRSVFKASPSPTHTQRRIVISKSSRTKQQTQTSFLPNVADDGDEEPGSDSEEVEEEEEEEERQYFKPPSKSRSIGNLASLVNSGVNSNNNNNNNNNNNSSSSTDSSTKKSDNAVYSPVVNKRSIGNTLNNNKTQGNAKKTKAIVSESLFTSASASNTHATDNSSSSSIKSPSPPHNSNRMKLFPNIEQKLEELKKSARETFKTANEEEKNIIGQQYAISCLMWLRQVSQ